MYEHQWNIEDVTIFATEDVKDNAHSYHAIVKNNKNQQQFSFDGKIYMNHSFEFKDLFESIVEQIDGLWRMKSDELHKRLEGIINQDWIDNVKVVVKLSN